MGGFQALMFIYGVCICLYGLYICKSKYPFIPKLHHKATRRYYKYVGKTTMLVGLAPILASIVSSISNTAFVFFLSIFILIFGTVMAFVVSSKYFK